MHIFFPGDMRRTELVLDLDHTYFLRLKIRVNKRGESRRKKNLFLSADKETYIKKKDGSKSNEIDNAQFYLHFFLLKCARPFVRKREPSQAVAVLPEAPSSPPAVVGGAGSVDSG